jgi:microcystin-dependent protein
MIFRIFVIVLILKLAATRSEAETEQFKFLNLASSSECGTPLECYLKATSEIERERTEMKARLEAMEKKYEQIINEKQKNYEEIINEKQKINEQIINDKIKKLESVFPSLGSIMFHTLNKAAITDQDLPNGWIFCDGRSLSKTEYTELFEIIGVHYGSNDANSFRIPDMRGRTVVGTGQGQNINFQIGNLGGEEYHTLSLSEMPWHQHGIDLYDTFDVVKLYDLIGNTKDYRVPRLRGSWLRSDPAGGNGAHNNMQPYLVLHPIIRVK